MEMIASLRQFAAWLSSYNRFRRTMRSWRDLRGGAGQVGLNSARVFIVPADPWYLVGSKGDEAMLVAVINQLRLQFGEIDFGVLTASDEASAAARSLGFEPFQFWHYSLRGLFSFICEYAPAAVIVIGADCMDGYYNPHTTLRFLALADLAACSGMRATITGFSFNEAPSVWLRKPFNMLSDKVFVNIRDEVSLSRFNRFCAARAQLVADCAFMLDNFSDSAPVRSLDLWVSGRRKKQQRVFGFNLHPMLVERNDPNCVGRIVDSCCAALAEYLATSEVSLVLLSHDYRNGGDDVCLAPIFDHLNVHFPGRVYYDKTQVSAAELKAMAGVLDGVVTGRMHLAIAALGMGVPVAAFSYQGKFEGMLQHFRMTSDLVMRPEHILNKTMLLDFLVRFEEKAPALRGLAQERLGDVLNLSALNVDGVL